MQISQRGLDFIKHQEGLVLHLYNDKAGHCTIGYGHLVHKGSICGDASEAPYKNGITLQQAETLLLQDVTRRVDGPINTHVEVPLTQSQYDALSSLVFNIGGENFVTSTLLRKLNSRDYTDAAAEFPRWNHAGGIVLPDLTQRRALEKAMFLETVC